MRLRIEIDLDNAAFRDDELLLEHQRHGMEVAYILRRLAEVWDDTALELGDSSKLRDSCGNAVGLARIIRTRAAAPAVQEVKL